MVEIRASGDGTWTASAEYMGNLFSIVGPTPNRAASEWADAARHFEAGRR
ncbi:hypothetical protein [Sphingomonas sp. R86521]